MRQIIMPSDVVLHRPTGETWTVCGVDHKAGRLIPYCLHLWKKIGEEYETPPKEYVG